MTTKLFNELGLSPEILRAIDRLGFEQASPIQAESIPVLMQGHDVVGQSQTGSGKTAAFAIPAIEKTDPLLRAVQILILCPTRELAVQVSEEIHKLALYKKGINALPIYGGQSYERQFYGLKQGAQIVIGTPGRVMDHMRRGTLILDKVKMLVLDEADVMLDMGFREDIEFVLQSVPKERQTVFFSATMPRPIRDLIERFARDPKAVQIEQKALTVPTVEQMYYEVDRRFKIELLTRLIDIHDIKLGIIFCNTKRMVDELVDHLEAQGYSADRLHGDMSQAMRDRVMNRFRKSGLEFLVATDVAARGIDVDDVQVVFNYDLPYDAEDYVHRIGRTGRAGRSGRAISFVAGREIFQVRNIERYTNTRIHRARIPTASEVEAARDNAFVEKIRSMLISGDYKRQDHLTERLLEEGHSSTDIVSVLLHLLGGGEPEAAPKAPKERADWSRGVDKSVPTRPALPAPGSTAPARSEATRPVRKPVETAAPATRTTAPAASSTEGSQVSEAASPSTVVETTPPGGAAPTTDEPGEQLPPAPTIAIQADESLAASESRKESKPTARKEFIRPEPRPEFQKTPRSTPIPARPFQRAVPPQSDRAPYSRRPDRERDGGRPTFGGADSRPPGRERAVSDTGPRREKSGGPRYRNMPEWAQKKMGVRFNDRRADRGERREPADSSARPAGSFPPASARPARDNFAASSKGPRAAKPSRRTPDNQTRLWLSVGEEMGVAAGDIVGAILGETGLPSGTVGIVDIRERHTFVDVVTEHVSDVLSKLRHTRIKGQAVKAKPA